MLKTIKLGIAVGALALSAPLAPSIPALADSSAAAQRPCNVQHEAWWKGPKPAMKWYVRVTNECFYPKNFCVDLPRRPDPGPFTILGNETREYAYSNAWWSLQPGTGIYYC